MDLLQAHVNFGGTRVGDLETLLKFEGVAIKHVEELVNLDFVDVILHQDVPPVGVHLRLLGLHIFEASLLGESVGRGGASVGLGEHGEVVVCH